MLLSFSSIPNEVKRPCPSTSLLSCTTTHLKLQSRMALNFRTEEAEVDTLESQVYQAALLFIVGLCVCARY